MLVRLQCDVPSEAIPGITLGKVYHGSRGGRRQPVATDCVTTRFRPISTPSGTLKRPKLGSILRNSTQERSSGLGRQNQPSGAVSGTLFLVFVSFFVERTQLGFFLTNSCPNRCAVFWWVRLAKVVFSIKASRWEQRDATPHAILPRQTRPRRIPGRNAIPPRRHYDLRSLVKELTGQYPSRNAMSSDNIAFR